MQDKEDKSQSAVYFSIFPGSPDQLSIRHITVVEGLKLQCSRGVPCTYCQRKELDCIWPENGIPLQKPTEGDPTP